jgi:hypothetical protein
VVFGATRAEARALDIVERMVQRTLIEPARGEETR